MTWYAVINFAFGVAFGVSATQFVRAAKKIRVKKEGDSHVENHKSQREDNWISRYTREYAGYFLRRN